MQCSPLPRILVAGLLLSAAATSLSAHAGCEASRDIDLSYPAAGLTELRISALAGRLDIESGSPGEITVSARACASNEDMLAATDIRTEQSGGIVELNTVIPQQSGGWNNRYAYIDLQVSVPPNLPTHVKDSSGHADVRDIHLVSFTDSSGDLRIRNTRGDSRIRDSSGYLMIRGHEGNLDLQDSSGDFEVFELTGNLTVDRDSSGDMEINTVSGFVLIDRDSSGDIEIENVGEDVEISSDGSGSIRIDQVQGSVTIGRDGSGHVRVSEVAGNLKVESKGEGKIRTKDVRGTIDIPHES